MTCTSRFMHYQGISSPSRLNEACSLLLQFNQGHSTELAPCSAERSAAAVPMSVLQNSNTLAPAGFTGSFWCESGVTPSHLSQSGPAAHQFKVITTSLGVKAHLRKENKGELFLAARGSLSHC